MKSVDKFGRYRGFHGGAAPRGMGFGLDKHGNYDMRKKQIKRVAAPTDGDDVVTLDYVREVWKLVNWNSDLILNVHKQLVPAMDFYVEEGKHRKLVPLIIDTFKEQQKIVEAKVSSDLIKKIETEINLKETKLSSDLKKKIDEEIAKKRLKIDRLEKEVQKIKEEAQNELKNLSDMTRAFVYKVTGPNFQRNSEESEKELRKSLKRPDNTWRAAFPEVADKLA